MARAMHGVGLAEDLIIEPILPSLRIIVKPNGRASAPNVNMVGKCKIGKAEVLGDFRNGIGELMLGLERSDITDEPVYTVEHSPQRQCRSATGDCSKSPYPACPFTKHSTAASQAEIGVYEF